VKRIALLVTAAALAVLVAVPAASAARITGTPGDDTLAGTDRRDFIYGYAGNDTLVGNGGSDFVFGGKGNDTATGDAGRDFLWGGPGNDTLEGGDHADVLYAGWGMDNLEGGPGNDILRAGENDGVPDVVDCGEGRDRALIRAGDIAIDCESVRTAPARRSRVHVQRGTPGDDTLVGTEKRDFILARAGNDTVSGLGATDFLFGQKGNDTLNGDDGADRLWGGSEDDLLNGGDGPDWLWAGLGADQLFGGEGNDRLFAAADDGAVDTLDCGEHADDRDRAVLRPGDTAVNCERVRILAP
jgi:Ca2+-binding RTX toxin-like protein